MILNNRIVIINKWVVGWIVFVFLFTTLFCLFTIWDFGTPNQNTFANVFWYFVVPLFLLSGFHHGKVFNLKNKQRSYWFGYFFLRYRKKYPSEPWTNVMVGPIENRYYGRGLYLDVLPIKILIGNTYTEVSVLGTEESALRLGIRIAKTADIPLLDATGSQITIRTFPEKQKTFSEMKSDPTGSTDSKPSPSFKPEKKTDGLSITVGLPTSYFYLRIALPTAITLVIGILMYWAWVNELHLLYQEPWTWALIVFYIGLFWSSVGLFVTWHRRLLGFRFLVSAKTGFHLFGKTIPPEDIQDIRVLGGAQGHSHLVICTEKKWVTFAYGFSVDELHFLRGLILSELASKS